MLYDENRQLHLHTTNVHWDFMIDSNRIMIVQLVIDFRVVFVDSPVNIDIDRDFQAFRHAEALYWIPSIVHKGINI